MITATPSAWIQGLPGQNPELFRLIHDFNERPGHWVHPERLLNVQHGSVAQNLLNAGASQTALQRWFGQQLGLGPTPAWWDFEEPRRRLALLGHDTLARLALFCGAAQCWKRMATIIGGPALKELKSAIGPEAHVFALRKGRQLMESSQNPGPSFESGSLTDDIKMNGWCMVMQVFAGESEALWQRLRLKLPPDEVVEAQAQTPEKNNGDEAVAARETAWKWTRRVMGDVLNRKELRCFV